MRLPYNSSHVKPLLLLIVLAGILSAACGTEDQSNYLVKLRVDGSERVYRHSEPVTVQQFLDEVDVELNPLDRVYPEKWTQIQDEMLITVTRVREEEYCEEVEIPFRQETRLFEGLEPGEEQIGQAGRNGVERVCYRVRIENGVRQEPVEISRVTQLEPVNEVILVGPEEDLEPVSINGTLAYINNQNAWIIRGSTDRKRLLTEESDLDSRVFSLTSDGRQLLVARETTDDATFNQLWIIPDTFANETQLLSLIPQDVLYAEWVPNENNTISYSTAESQTAPPGWRAFNDLWLMSVDPSTGQQIRTEQILEQSSGGIYGWWGTQFDWSPSGDKLAWIQADSIGLVDLENQTLGQPLLEYTELNPLQDWSWRSTVSWSPGGELIAATVHGEPVGDEPPATSPVFNVAVASTTADYSAELVPRSGIWATPRFSPEFRNDDSEFPQGYIAYLQVRQWDSSISGEYDLVIADRDGSNARKVFPGEDKPGMTAEEFAQDFTWSPEGRQIALIYQGNLWIINVETGASYQVTQDSGASKPVWTQ